jgi:hypothetical protein
MVGNGIIPLGIKQGDGIKHIKHLPDRECKHLPLILYFGNL